MSSRGRATNMSTVTRAGVVSAGAAVVAATALPGLARAAALPAPRAYAATAVPSSRDLHLMRRFSFGFSATLQQQVATAGGARAWFTAQLSPDTIPDTFADGLRGWFPRLEASPLAAWTNQRAGRVPRPEYISSIARHSMLRQVYSNRQVHEVMVDFWLNHFHVFVQDNHAWPFRPAVRRHDPHPRPGSVRGPAEGRRHPPGDAAVPRPGPVDRNQAQREPRTGAPRAAHRGHRRRLHREPRQGLRPDPHRPARRPRHPRAVLQRGRPLPRPRHRDGLHPRQRRRSGTCGARRVPLLPRASPRHRPPAGPQARGPLRVRRPPGRRSSSGWPRRTCPPTPTSGPPCWRWSTTRSSMTRPPRRCGPPARTSSRPCGPSVPGSGSRPPPATRRGRMPSWAWSPASANGPGTGSRPTGSPTGPTPGPRRRGCSPRSASTTTSPAGSTPGSTSTTSSARTWLPQRRIRFDLLVDHLCRRLHGSGSTPELLGAACAYLEVSPGTVITAAHSVCGRKMPWLLALLLDSPAHMTR